MRSLLQSLVRRTYRALMPPGAKNTLRQWLLLEERDKPPVPIEDFSEGRVLVLAPHMDDEIIGCGGALCRHVNAGAPVTVVWLTDGSRGDPNLGLLPPSSSLTSEQKRLVATRHHESTSAADTIGVQERIFLDEPDGALSPSPRVIERLRGIIGDSDPAVIYLPSLLDTHPDHWAATSILYECATALPNPGPRVRQYEVWSPLLANCLAGIGDQVDVKRRALEQFTSQLANLDLVECTLGLNRYRALHPAVDSNYAEAFFESSITEFRTLYERLAAPPEP